MPGFAVFHMEPLEEAHLVKELLWNLGHIRILLGAAGDVTAPYTGTGTGATLGSLVQPSLNQSPLGLGPAAAPFCPRGVDTAGATALFYLEKGESNSSCRAVASGTFQGVPQCW